MPPRVHFTHHACGQYIEHEGFDERWRRAGYPVSRYGSAIDTPFKGCHDVRFAGRATTTAPARVTCERCRAMLDGRRGRGIDTDSSLSPQTDHREQIKRAWITCCRHRAAVCPLTAGELAAIQADNDAAQRELIVAEIDLLLVVARRQSEADVLRDDCGRMLALLGEVARPAIAELLLAAEWLDHAAAAVDRAGVLFGELSARARAGELDAAAARCRRERVNNLRAADAMMRAIRSLLAHTEAA